MTLKLTLTQYTCFHKFFRPSDIRFCELFPTFFKQTNIEWMRSWDSDLFYIWQKYVRSDRVWIRKNTVHNSSGFFFIATFKKVIMYCMIPLTIKISTDKPWLFNVPIFYYRDFSLFNDDSGRICVYSSVSSWMRKSAKSLKLQFTTCGETSTASSSGGNWAWGRVREAAQEGEGGGGRVTGLWPP